MRLRIGLKAHVVMGNDFPDAVRLTKRGAEAYIARCKENERKQGLVQPWNARGPGIHYRAYEFDIGPGINLIFFRGATMWEGAIGRLWFKWPREKYRKHATPAIGWDTDD